MSAAVGSGRHDADAGLRLALSAEPLRQAIEVLDAVHVARDTGVWAAIEHGPRTATEVAAACWLTETACTRLLDALVVTDVACRDGDRYQARHPPEALDELVRRRERLERRVRGAGEPPQSQDGYRIAAPLLAARFADEHARVADLLGPPGGLVIDVGAGVSPVGRLLAARHGARVAAIDALSVLEQLRSAVSRDGLTAHFELVAGDARTVDWPQRASLVLLCGILHLLPPADARHLVRRAAASLGPGGRAAIATFAATDPPGRRQALYALDLLLRAPEGALYPYARLAAWLGSAGFVGIRREAVGPMWLITASTPGDAASPASAT